MEDVLVLFVDVSNEKVFFLLCNYKCFVKLNCVCFLNCVDLDKI